VRIKDTAEHLEVGADQETDAFSCSNIALLAPASAKRGSEVGVRPAVVPGRDAGVGEQHRPNGAPEGRKAGRSGSLCRASAVRVPAPTLARTPGFPDPIITQAAPPQNQLVPVSCIPVQCAQLA